VALKYEFDPARFGALIKGFPNELIADVVGVTRFTIGRWKKGQGEPTAVQFVVLVAWLEEQKRVENGLYGDVLCMFKRVRRRRRRVADPTPV
jgi:hypothetical protein